MDDDESKVTRIALTVMVVIVAAVGFAALVLSLLVQVKDVTDQNKETIELLRECTSPGTRAPTKQDPSTGHDCYDRGQRRSAASIAKIIDADGNGKLDTTEIMAVLKRIEQYLMDAGADAEETGEPGAAAGAGLKSGE